MENGTVWRTLFFLAVGVGMSHAACAQEVVGGDTLDAAGTRSQPAYDALGIRLGSFLLYPTMSTSAAFDSNVFARSVARQSDASVTVVPALTLRRTAPGQELSLDANARLRRYATLISQDDEQYRVDAAGRFQVGDGATIVSGHAAWSSETATRGTFENGLQTGDPLKKETVNGEFSVQHRFNRLTARIGASGQRFVFDDVRLAGGSVLDQSYRNGVQFGSSVGLSYQLGPRVSAQVQGSIQKFDYDDPNLITSRDATGYSMTAGGSYEVTRLFYFDFGVGFRKHNFKNVLFSDSSGLALQSSLRWYPSPLLSVRFDISQATSTNSSALVAAVEVTSAKLGADYELKRNLTFTIGSELSREDYGRNQGTSTFLSFEARLNWKLNRWLRVAPSASFQSRRGSTSARQTFDAFRAGLGVTLAR